MSIENFPVSPDISEGKSPLFLRSRIHSINILILNFSLDSFSNFSFRLLQYCCHSGAYIESGTSPIAEQNCSKFTHFPIFLSFLSPIKTRDCIYIVSSSEYGHFNRFFGISLGEFGLLFIDL